MTRLKEENKLATGLLMGLSIKDCRFISHKTAAFIDYKTPTFINYLRFFVDNS